MADYLKKGNEVPPEASPDVRRRVAEMLEDIKERGEAAVRESS